MRRTRRNPFAASASAVAKSSSEKHRQRGRLGDAAGGAFDWRGLGNALGFVLIVDSGKTERQAAHWIIAMAQHPARVRFPRRNVALALGHVLGDDDRVRAVFAVDGTAQDSSSCLKSMPSNCGLSLMIRDQPSTPTTGTMPLLWSGNAYTSR